MFALGDISLEEATDAFRAYISSVDAKFPPTPAALRIMSKKSNHEARRASERSSKSATGLSGQEFLDLCAKKFEAGLVPVFTPTETEGRSWYGFYPRSMCHTVQGRIRWQGISVPIYRKNP